MATILDGKALAAKVKEQVKQEAEGLARKPGLAVIIVGNNPASRVYVNSKRKDCEECGFLSEEYALPEETTQQELITLIQKLNARQDIDGILCQLPLPDGIDEEAVLMAISPEKDVDGFHPMNMGALLVGKEGFLPCTPYGIMEILDEYGIDPKGKRCVVIGRSNIVGKPMALLLLQRHGTVNDPAFVKEQALKALPCSGVVQSGQPPQVFFSGLETVFPALKISFRNL